MGPPLAPVIADIFMAHLETTLMDKLTELGVCEWHRYVDDTFVLVHPTAKVSEILDVLNQFHPSIKFTHEVEENQSIPFLDVLISRYPQHGTFETTIYRKATFTGLMINWNSFVPLQYKRASVMSMVRRALAICSTYSALTNEFDEIRRIALNNDYPRNFIDTSIGIGLSQYRNRESGQQQKPIGCEKKQMYVEIPYVDRATSTLKKQITHLAGAIRPDLDIRFFAKPPPSIQTLFQAKDPILKPMQSDVVYSVQCSDCSHSYIGKTQRQSIRRLKEHGAPKNSFDSILNQTSHEDNEQTELRRSSRLRNKATKTTASSNDERDVVISNSALLQHEKQTGHRINWTDFRVVWQDNHPYRLLIKESLLIQAFEPELNRTTHSVPLLVFPNGLPRNLLPDPNG